MWEGLATVTMSLAGFGLTWLVQSSALLVLGLLAGRFLKRPGPAVQSAAYRTTLAAVLICPAASALLAGAGFDGFLLRLPSPPVAADMEPASPATDPRRWTATPEARSEVPPLDVVMTDPEPGVVSHEEATVAPTSPIEVMPAPDRPRAGFSRPTAAAIMLGLSAWLLGSAMMGVRLLVGQRRMGRLRASALPAEPAVEALCRDLAGRLGLRAPAVLRSPFLFSPCLDGLRRPAILLPDDVEDNLRETFVHELAHLARRDGFWNLLRRTAVAAFWVQPLLWALSRRLEVTAEEVCDDYVVQFGADRARYAGHLLELAGRALPPVAPAGVGMVSLRSMLARRIVRLLDTSRSLSTRAGTRAVLAMLVVGLAGTLFAGLLGVGSGRSEALAQVAEADPAPEGETVRGQVVGPEGTPVPGAKVTAWRRRARLLPEGFGYKSSPAGMWQYEYVRKVADAEGRFEVTFSPPEPDATATEGAGGVSVIATAPGFGLGCHLKDQPIRLTAGDQPVNGRLVDLEGRPVAGANVRMFNVWIPEPEARREADARSGPYEFPFAKSIGLDGEPALPGGVVTDSDGRFRIEGLGRDVMALLEISGPRVTFKRFRVISRAKGPLAAEPREGGSRDLVDPANYGADCTVAVEPTRLIEGIVRDIETKEPIQGASVSAFQLSGSKSSIEGLIRTETDAQGRYRLVGLPKEGEGGHKLVVHPPLDLPYFITDRLAVPAAPGMEPVRFDIALRRVTWATGRVKDIRTGKPVANALVDYFPFLSNERAKDYPNFDPATYRSIDVKTRYRTDKEGQFRIAALPGRGVVTVYAEAGTYRSGFGAEAIEGRTDEGLLTTYDRISASQYHGLKEVNIPEGSTSFVCDVSLDPGGSLKVRLVDPSGKPVTHALVTGRVPDSVDRDRGLRGEGVVSVTGLVPGKPRTLLVQEPVRKIGAVLTVPPGGSNDGDEIILTLRPNASLTGRLVDEEGKPAKGYVTVRLVPAVVDFHGILHIADVPIDPDGRFRCEELPAGGPYTVMVANGLGILAMPQRNSGGFKPFNLTDKLNVESGQVVDFGTYNVTTGKRVEPPVAESGPADVPITGRVVDLEGRPVAGVTVKTGTYLVPKSGDLTPWLDGVRKGEEPWIATRHVEWNRNAPETATREATTDKDGRFRLEGFGAERVAQLELQGETIACTTIDVVTRMLDPIPAPGFRNGRGPGRRTIYGADFTYTAAPSRPVVGVVKAAETGRPLAGAEVRSYRFAGSNVTGTMILRTKTDEQGRFRLTGLPKGKGNELIIVPNDGQPYFMQVVALPDPPGAGPVPVEAAVYRGIWIEGKVTERVSEKPVSGVRLYYMPFLGNTFAQAHPEFGKDGNTDGTAFQDRYQTKADGTFRLVGLPGRAIVGAFVPDTSYMPGVGSEAIRGMNKAGHFETYRNPANPGKLWPTVMKEINPNADAELVHVDLQVATGPSVRLRIVDAGGNPVTGVKTEGRSGRESYERGVMTKAEGEVTNLMPDEERTVLLRHEGRKIGKVVRIREGDDAKGPVVVTLEPLAELTGRVADADGNPASGARVRPDPLPSGDYSLSLAQVATAEDGRFRVSDVPTGCDYGLAIESLGTIKGVQFVYKDRATVKPGETTDVGEIRFERD